MNATLLYRIVACVFVVTAMGHTQHLESAPSFALEISVVASQTVGVFWPRRDWSSGMGVFAQYSLQI
jgi:hypothetical protein